MTHLWQRGGQCLAAGPRMRPQEEPCWCRGPWKNLPGWLLPAENIRSLTRSMQSEDWPHGGAPGLPCNSLCGSD